MVATALLAALLLVAAPAARAQDGSGVMRCNTDTPLTLFGVDTVRGDLLLRSSGGWLVQTRPEALDAGGGDWSETAAYYREPTERRIYGGSMGAGPIFGVHSCGDHCLQAVAWAAGEWVPMGQPLRNAPSGIAHTTYDRAGYPWLVLQQPLPPGEGPDDGVTSHAWRLQDSLWISRGSATARSSGASAALAAPDRSDAILSGTVRFAAHEKPVSWLSTLPALPPEEEGVLVPARQGAAYLTARGRLLLSRDGQKWVRSRWTPWGDHPTRLWAPGKDYTLDLPSGDRQGRLHAVFVDRRENQAGRLYLVTWEPDGEWRRVADLHSEISTLNGERLDYGEIALASPDTWVLLAGCVNTANGPGLVLRTVGSAGLTRPRFLPLVPGSTPR